ncbi:MAG TPA: hypothetical protein VNR63_09075, partial [Gaiellaceae bacterium]|nr:hypothetical protein [Gaiellaceae bacterium]
MAVRQVQASGLEYLALVTQLLQRARRSDPEAGQWEAADLQWWWRLPRRSDDIGQLFWLDDDGPVAAAVLTRWRDGWSLDPVVVPGCAVPLATVWADGLEAVESLGIDSVDV